MFALRDRDGWRPEICGFLDVAPAVRLSRGRRPQNLGSRFKWLSCVVLLIGYPLVAAAPEDRLVNPPPLPKNVLLDVEDISVLRVSPDGKWIVKGNMVVGGAPIILLEVRTGKVHNIAKKCLHGENFAFSPDGKWLASELGGLWELQSKREKIVWTSQARPAFRRDGHFLLGAGYDHIRCSKALGTIDVYDLRLSKMVATLVMSNPIHEAVFVADRREIVFWYPKWKGGDRSWSWKVWDWEKDEIIRTVELPTGSKELMPYGIEQPALGPNISPDGRIIAATDEKQQVLYLYDVLTGEKKFTLPFCSKESKDSICCAVYTTDAKHLAVGTTNGAVHLLDIASGLLKKIIEDVNLGQIDKFKFSRDGQRLSFADFADQYYILDIDKGKLVGSFKEDDILFLGKTGRRVLVARTIEFGDRKRVVKIKAVTVP